MQYHSLKNGPLKASRFSNIGESTVSALLAWALVVDTAPAKNIKLPAQYFRNNVRELGLGTPDIDIAEA